MRGRVLTNGARLSVKNIIKNYGRSHKKEVPEGVGRRP